MCELVYLGMNSKDLSTGTQQQTHQPLYIALKDAVRLEIVNCNMADVVRFSSLCQAKADLTIFTQKELEKFLEAVLLDY